MNNMTDKQLMDQMTENDVLKVYSGKAHKCCCGCSGAYRANPAHAHRMSQYCEAKDFNMTQVRRVLNIVRLNIENKLACPMVERNADGLIKWASVTVGERMYTVYTVSYK